MGFFQIVVIYPKKEKEKKLRCTFDLLSNFKWIPEKFIRVLRCFSLGMHRRLAASSRSIGFVI